MHVHSRIAHSVGDQREVVALVPRSEAARSRLLLAADPPPTERAYRPVA
jgi:hypothetical protein